MSQVLDDETREVFSQTLQTLQAEKNRDVAYERTILKGRNCEPEPDEQPKEHRKLDTSPVQQRLPGTDQASGGRRESDSEKDYGIEGPSTAKSETKPKSSVSPKTLQPPQSSRTKLSPTVLPSSTSNKLPTEGFYTRGVAVLVTLQHIILNIRRSMSQNPMVLLRTIMFLVGVILAFSRRDVRDRVSRITAIGWEKVRGTVGMGVKVSYI